MSRLGSLRGGWINRNPWFCPRSPGWRCLNLREGSGTEELRQSLWEALERQKMASSWRERQMAAHSLRGHSAFLPSLVWSRWTDTCLALSSSGGRKQAAPTRGCWLVGWCLWRLEGSRVTTMPIDLLTLSSPCFHTAASQGRGQRVRMGAGMVGRQWGRGVEVKLVGETKNQEGW